MVKQVNLESHTLGEEVVLDGVSSINAFKSFGPKAAIYGGMAVQAYIPRNLHRDTIDIDYSSLWNGSSVGYRELCEPLIVYLQERGYDVNFRKKGLTYELVYSNSGKSFMIQHPRRSKKYFGRFKGTLERELDNQNEVSFKGVSFGVVRPEDLIAHKLHRVLLFSNKYGLKIPSKTDLCHLRDMSNNLKDDIISRSGEMPPEDVANLRMINDLYDIRCLSSNVPFDEQYFRQIISEWGEVEDSFYSIIDKS